MAARVIGRRAAARTVLVALLASSVVACVPQAGPLAGGVTSAELADFAGRWQGAATLVNVPRNLEMRITPAADGGFRLDWTALEPGGAGAGLSERRRSLGFAPAVLGTYTATDADAGETVTAWIEGATLNIEIDDHGDPTAPVEQSWEATLLSSDRLSLAFRIAGTGTELAEAEVELARAAPP